MGGSTRTTRVHTARATGVRSSKGGSGAQSGSRRRGRTAALAATPGAKPARANPATRARSRVPSVASCRRSHPLPLPSMTRSGSSRSLDAASRSRQLLVVLQRQSENCLMSHSRMSDRVFLGGLHHGGAVFSHRVSSNRSDASDRHRDSGRSRIVYYTYPILRPPRKGAGAFDQATKQGRPLRRFTGHKTRLPLKMLELGTRSIRFRCPQLLPGFHSLSSSVWRSTAGMAALGMKHGGCVAL